MCGIAGYFGKTPPTDSMISGTLKLMKNRGPDHQDFAIFKGGENHHIFLLHSRLSIIDLDPRSNQPFTIGESTIIYNGEIYNYIELRKQLLIRGIKLRTSSDTEVLLHYYLIYGEQCVQHFEGMWSFAIWDKRYQKLFLSRDRFAEKPLYYRETEEGFIFGSETKFIKALSRKEIKVNHKHLMRNIVNGYKALYKTDETYFEGIKELHYANSMVIQPKGKKRIERYWTPTVTVDESMSIEHAIEGTRDHLLESVRIRLRSDVPLAFCLSGGVDSASLVSIASKEFGCQLETFSIIDQDERYDEKENILATVNDVGCNHHLLEIPKEDALSRLSQLIAYHDAPVATISYYVHSLISDAVNKAGFRVAFSGSSADELFTGYYDHFILHLNEIRKEKDYQTYLKDWKTHIQGFIRNPVFKKADLYLNEPNFRSHIFDANEELKDYLLVDFDEPFQENKFCDSLLRNRMLNELFHETTPLILHEDDLNSMCYSVENRSPYLDTNLLKFACSIPARHLIKDGYGKFVLRQALKGTLNEKVRLDRRKKGFNASINSMIDFQDSGTRAYLLDPSAEIFEYIEINRIKQLFNRFPIPNHLSKFLFNFINARIFLENHN